jgi:hypothetical protein
MIQSMAKDPRWERLEQGRSRLLNRLREVGVIRVEFVAGFPQLGLSAVWLCTATDQQRAALNANLPADEVERALLEAGFPSADLHGLKIVSQSQETVDREHEGSWFYAIR